MPDQYEILTAGDYLNPTTGNTNRREEGDIVPAGELDQDAANGWLSTQGHVREVEGYAKWNLPELEAAAKKRKLEVNGTGKDGAVLKRDLVDALEAHDREER